MTNETGQYRFFTKIDFPSHDSLIEMLNDLQFGKSPKQPRSDKYIYCSDGEVLLLVSREPDTTVMAWSYSEEHLQDFRAALRQQGFIYTAPF